MTDLDEYRAIRFELEVLSGRIESAKDGVDSLRQLRVEKWREFESQGVSRAKMAKWSGVDPMLVSRALNGDD